MTDRRRLSEALARTGEGSRSALAEVYESTSAKLFGICLRILRDRGEAEDALQDIYVNIWRNASRFDPERSSPITWLAAIARNRAIDRLRASGRHVHAPLADAMEVADPARDAAASLEASQAGARLSLCMEELEARQAQAIRNAFFEGAPYSELAARGGVPLGTMKSWVRRGLLRLRECMRDG